jgi:hypothetical protein
MRKKDNRIAVERWMYITGKVQYRVEWEKQQHKKREQEKIFSTQPEATQG